jgi:hypothetical protein
MRTFIIRLCFFTVWAITVLELFFRFVIPGCELPYTDFDTTNMISRFETNGRRTGLATHGRLAVLRSQWHINNEGWNSNVEYVPSNERDRPLIAVIGDSFIAGFTVALEDDMASLLRGYSSDEQDVYSFGVSGSSFIHYLQLLRYARDQFRPDLYIVVVTNDDLEKGFTYSPNVQGYLQIGMTDTGLVEYPAIPFPPAPWTRRIAMRSGLVRYLVINLELYTVIRSIRQYSVGKFRESEMDDEDHVPRTDVATKSVSARRERIAMVLDYATSRMRAEASGVPILFAMDASSEDIGAERTDSSVVWMSDLMRVTAERNGAMFLDLLPVLEQHHRLHGQDMNLDIPGLPHWNALGNRVVARTVYDEIKNRGLFDTISIADTSTQ